MKALTALMLALSLPGYHWETFATMRNWLLVSDSDKETVAICWTDPQGVFYGNLGTHPHADKTQYANLQACESDLESKVK